MMELSFASKVSLYVLVALMTFFILILWWWQVQVLRGRSMKKPDGSVDDWHLQKIYYGIAFADVFIACPAGIIGVILTILGSRWGFFILALLSFFFVWINTAFTVTSLKFENPELSLEWFAVYPFGILLGIAYLVWMGVYFDGMYLE